MRLASLIKISTIAGLAGCSPSTKYAEMDILFIDGCALHVAGATAKQSENMLSNWEFGEDCGVKVISELDDEGDN